MNLEAAVNGSSALSHVLLSGIEESVGAMITKGMATFERLMLSYVMFLFKERLK